MKTKTFFIISVLAAALQFAPTLSAEPADGQGRGHRDRQGRHARMFENLSKEERTQLRAAHQKAKADPAFQAAKDRRTQSGREFREQRRAALLRADPTIQPVLDKMPARSNRDS